ncbi:MAG: molybdopterin-dependent oxidoreductase [Deltaproteobacteria bacterium]|nr:molybdopterin-dependent oxidoreductase [Deltaproteobacteria bacterium]
MPKILRRENGFPVRLAASSKYAYKIAKWVRRVTFQINKGRLGILGEERLFQQRRPV